MHVRNAGWVAAIAGNLLTAGALGFVGFTIAGMCRVGAREDITGHFFRKRMEELLADRIGKVMAENVSVPPNSRCTSCRKVVLHRWFRSISGSSGSGMKSRVWP